MSNFSYQDSYGNLTTVPVMYGDLSRQVAHVIKQNSENTIPSAPRMAVYITALEMDRDRTSSRSIVSKMNIREREFDSATGDYTSKQGRNYTVERPMPSPYILRYNVDIWTTNTQQKLQILEQLLSIFNPSLEIQSTDNYIDWTSLSVINFDGLNYSTRSIPTGTESEIDVAQLSLSTPIYLSTPIRVKKLGVIQKIITSIFDEAGGTIELGLSGPEMLSYADNQPIVQQKVYTTINEEGEVDVVNDNLIEITENKQNVSSVTWQNYSLLVDVGTAKLINNNDNVAALWPEVFEAYPGLYQAEVSRIFIPTLNESYIVGTFTLESSDASIINIVWDPDTIPSDTVIVNPIRLTSRSTIDYIIDPLKFNPTQEKVAGLRLITIKSIGNIANSDGADAWKNNNNTDFIAEANDIVEWDGNSWTVAFKSADNSEAFVTNVNTGNQYMWNGTMWTKSYDGRYSHGSWRLDLDG
jgi:hypothetical protein